MKHPLRMPDNCLNWLRNCVAMNMLAILIGMSIPCMAQAGDEWNRFRGPNGSGLVVAGNLPVKLDKASNLMWKRMMPAGHSSPILSGERVFLTAFESDRLLVFCLDQRSGDIIWQWQAQRRHEENWDHRNNPASPSPATDGEHLVVFFPEIGLIAFNMNGEEQWQLPLGPFNNIYGMGASPIIVEDKVILVCDQSVGSYIIAVSKKTGEIAWKTSRPEAKSGHSTPIVYQASSDETQILVPGSFQLVAYALESGKKRWWVNGLSFEMKSTPVMANGVLFINGYGSPMNQPENRVYIDDFETTLAKQDTNRNGSIDKGEMPKQVVSWLFPFVDLDGDSLLAASDWAFLEAVLSNLNGMLAIRLGGEGNMTDSNMLWQYRKSVPQLPSPLLYKDVLYMINDGGITTSFQPESGEVIKQGRLKGAVDQYYASPVAADNKIYMTSRRGKVSVLSLDGQLEVLQVNDLGEQCYATPAIADGRFYIRTVEALYCFGNQEKQ